jgi:hypothetical protein
VSAGCIKISHDVVFDEAIFPFHSLHPNDGAHLHVKILLLPSHLSNNTSTVEDVHVDDHLPIVHVTN